MNDTPGQRFLLARHPGYADLTQDERQALNDFCLLWPVFEGSILGDDYTGRDLLQVATTLNGMGLLRVDTLAAEIQHFHARYFRDGDFTPLFDGLHVERTTRANEKVIRDFLLAGPHQPIETALQGVLMIALRYRNNTFHGAKALYGYRDQLANFRAACAVLMFVLEHHPLRY
ncbi:hypothetical protein J2W30_002251 [Variovorax boronicumulans]|uniref:hypothetical protein n=1 Tax=Variovorax boronicumulans TaxID=436515 RepID=UPI00277E3A4D|nr:hypothetical protein [Variovorax boronicumulans]MDQ0034496.1 hypothetical protein [Variovorax boronicumulans]